MRLVTFDDVKDLQRDDWVRIMQRGARDLDAKAVANHIMRTLAFEVPSNPLLNRRSMVHHEDEELDHYHYHE